MPTKVERRTVDLSQFPELVVIYLGMRVNRMTGLKTLFGFGPKISASVAAQPDGLLLHENHALLAVSCARRHAPVLARYGLTYSRGRAPNPIANGGRTFCATRVAPDSGTRRISCAAALKPFTTTCRSPSA